MGVLFSRYPTPQRYFLRESITGVCLHSRIDSGQRPKEGIGRSGRSCKRERGSIIYDSSRSNSGDSSSISIRSNSRIAINRNDESVRKDRRFGSGSSSNTDSDKDDRESSIKASVSVIHIDDDKIDNCSNNKAEETASDTCTDENVDDSNRNSKNLDVGEVNRNNKNNDNSCSDQEKSHHDHEIFSDATVQDSTSKLLECLAEFLVHKHNSNGRKGFRPPHVCAWLRKIDVALLREGWQTVSFLNSSNLVLIFLLVRDLPPRADLRTSEFRSHVLACLYLAYSFSGPEITYPFHHFLARSACDLFWERMLMLVNKHSTEMLRLYREPEFYRKILCELKMYSSPLCANRKF